MMKTNAIVLAITLITILSLLACTQKITDQTSEHSEAPSELKVIQLDSTAFRLSWHDNSENETGFIIERASDQGAFYVVGQTGKSVSTYIDTISSSEHKYRYRVKANSTNENSSISNEFSITSIYAPQITSVKLDTITKSLNIIWSKVSKISTMACIVEIMPDHSNILLRTISENDSQTTISLYKIPISDTAKIAIKNISYQDTSPASKPILLHFSEMEAKLIGECSGQLSIAVSQDDNKIAVGGTNKIDIFNIATGDKFETSLSDTPNCYYNELAFSSEGNILVAICQYIIAAFNATSGVPLWNKVDQTGNDQRSYFVTSSGNIVIQSAGGVQCLDVFTGKTIWIAKNYMASDCRDYTASKSIVIKNDTIAAINTGDGSISSKVNLSTDHNLPFDNTSCISKLIMSPNSSYIAGLLHICTGGPETNDAFSLFSTINGAILLNGICSGYLNKLTFSPDSRKIAAGCYSMFGAGVDSTTVELWDIVSAKRDWVAYFPDNQITDVCFSNDGSTILASGISGQYSNMQNSKKIKLIASKDGKLIWDGFTGDAIGRFFNSESAIAVVSSDSLYILHPKIELLTN